MLSTSPLCADMPCMAELAAFSQGHVLLDDGLMRASGSDRTASDDALLIRRQSSSHCL